MGTRCFNAAAVSAHDLAQNIRLTLGGLRQERGDGLIRKGSRRLPDPVQRRQIRRAQAFESIVNPSVGRTRPMAPFPGDRQERQAQDGLQALGILHVGTQVA